MKNSIKPIYFKEFIELCNYLDLIPEQEQRYKVLIGYLKRAKKSDSLMSLFAYFIDRLTHGEEAKYYFMVNTVEDKDNFKINMEQLRFASLKINTSKQLQTSIIEWFSNISNKYVVQYIAAYFNIKNIIGLKYNILEEIFDTFKMSKYIQDVTLSSFYYEAIADNTKVITSRKIKSPFLLTKEQGELVYFHKFEGNIYSNLSDNLLQELSNILVRYKKLSIVGLLKPDNSISCFICSTRDKVVKKLIGEKEFTLQNSFRYLLPDLNRVNTSIKGWSAFGKIQEFSKLECDLYWSEEDMLIAASLMKPTFIISRNTISEVEYSSNFIISEITDAQYILTNIRGTEVVVLRNDVVNQDDFSIGDKVFQMKLSGNLFLVKRGTN